MYYKSEDLKTVKRIISETMALIQILADQLTRKRYDLGLTHTEKEMLSGLNACYDRSVDTIQDIEAVENDLPPWDEDPA